MQKNKKIKKNKIKQNKLENLPSKNVGTQTKICEFHCKLHL